MIKDYSRCLPLSITVLWKVLFKYCRAAIFASFEKLLLFVVVVVVVVGLSCSKLRTQNCNFPVDDTCLNVVPAWTETINNTENLIFRVPVTQNVNIAYKVQTKAIFDNAASASRSVNVSGLRLANGELNEQVRENAWKRFWTTHYFGAI